MPRDRKIRRFSYRGFEEDTILAMSNEELFALFRSRIRRKLDRSSGIKGPYRKLLDKVVESKNGVAPGEKPEIIKTRLRNAIIVPTMVGAIVGVYTGRDYQPVEIKFNMIGRYLGEFGITYKHARHIKTGKGATKSSKHVSKT